MNKYILKLLSIGTVVVFFTLPVQSQSFDFDELQNIINEVSVIVEMKVEYSFGVHNNEQEERYLGTIVTDDGLVLFNGFTLSSENSIAAFTGMNVKTNPTNIIVQMTDGKEYTAEYIGVDRFSNIGFLQINTENGETFNALKFKSNKDYKIGEWVSLFMLLPEYINPPFSADIGMVSSIIVSPEYFPLIIGFNAMQMTSVLFDENLEAVGVLGRLNDPGQSSIDQSGMLDSFNSFGMPLLGIITSERIEKMIADPPRKGKSDRGWLGITLQALTTDMAGFWGLDLTGGIILNDIVSNSPAEKAGLIIGDIIYEVNGQAVEVDKEEKISIFQRAISEMGPSTAVEFSILRPNEETFDSLVVLATLENTPMAATDAPEYENKELEFKVREMVFADYLFYNLDAETFKGTVVSELKQGGLANLEGLRIGDIIQRIGNQQVQTIFDIETILNEAKESKLEEIIFFVWRNQKTLFVNVKTEW